MLAEDLLYQISLGNVPHIGHVHAKLLADVFPSARSIFEAREETLEKIEGIGQVRAGSIRRFKDFHKAEKEIVFIQKYAVEPLFLKDPAYPKRLLNCYDPPTLLYFKGNADLNTSKIVSIVGTRRNTDYGKSITEKLVEELSELNVLVVSGLAFGIDAIAHKAALKNNLQTVGVVGHGLDTIYPPENSDLAREMLRSGGILTEFGHDTKPEKHHFPARNRVVAGISDVTVIIESGIKGGSMITAEIAGSYNRDVFALPGRITDAKSAGCNELIRSNRAVLFNDSTALLEHMGWNEKAKNPLKAQKELFIPLTENERIIIKLLNEKEFTQIDEINMRSSLSSSAIAAALLNLEMQLVVKSLPGKRYGMIN
ncbi:MAG: DNA-processing protein DprA [Flavitalea sp.]